LNENEIEMKNDLKKSRTSPSPIKRLKFDLVQQTISDTRYARRKL